MSASSLIEAISGHIRSLNYLQARENVDALGLLCNEDSSSLENFTKYLIYDIFLKMAMYTEGQSTEIPESGWIESSIRDMDVMTGLFADDERVRFRKAYGEMLCKMKDFDGSEKYLTEAFGLGEATIGVNNSLVLSTMHSLGKTLLLNKSLIMAEGVMKRCVDIKITLLGRAHSSTLRSIKQLVLILQSFTRDSGDGIDSDVLRRKQDESLTYYLLLEEIYKEKLNATNNNYDAEEVEPCRRFDLLQETYDGLANLYMVMDREEAIIIYQKQLALMRLAYGSSHPKTLTAIRKLCISLRTFCRYEQATPYYREYLATYRNLFPKDDRLIIAINNLAGNLKAEANVIARQISHIAFHALSIDEKLEILRDCHAYYYEHINLTRECVELSVDLHGEDSSDTAKWLNMEVMCYLDTFEFCRQMLFRGQSPAHHSDSDSKQHVQAAREYLLEAFTLINKVLKMKHDKEHIRKNYEGNLEAIKYRLTEHDLADLDRDLKGECSNSMSAHFYKMRNTVNYFTRVEATYNQQQSSMNGHILSNRKKEGLHQIKKWKEKFEFYMEQIRNTINDNYAPDCLQEMEAITRFDEEYEGGDDDKNGNETDNTEGSADFYTD